MKSDKLCECGCGDFTNVADRNIKRRGVVKGQPMRFIEHHAARAALESRKALRGRGELHGHSMRSPTYRTWIGMVQRCTKPSHHAWGNYGGRGIRVCEQWLTFVNFLEDMGERPEGTTLDRIDVNGDYDKGNCRWISRFAQHANYRNNVKLTFNGKTQHIAAWERETGLGKRTIRDRLARGWSVEDALTLPAGARTALRRSEQTGRYFSSVTVDGSGTG